MNINFIKESIKKILKKEHYKSIIKETIYKTLHEAYGDIEVREKPFLALTHFDDEWQSFLEYINSKDYLISMFGRHINNPKLLNQFFKKIKVDYRTSHFANDEILGIAVMAQQPQRSGQYDYGYAYIFLWDKQKGWREENQIEPEEWPNFNPWVPKQQNNNSDWEVTFAHVIFDHQPEDGFEITLNGDSLLSVCYRTDSGNIVYLNIADDESFRNWLCNNLFFVPGTPMQQCPTNRLQQMLKSKIGNMTTQSSDRMIGQAKQWAEQYAKYMGYQYREETV